MTVVLTTLQPEYSNYVRDPDAVTTTLQLPSHPPETVQWEIRVRSEMVAEALSKPYVPFEVIPVPLF